MILIPSAADPASQCTPAHCTLGDVGAMYSSASFLVGIVAIIIVVLVLRALSRAARRS